MKILKECHCLYQCYYETSNAYLNVCLLKTVILLSNHENHHQTASLTMNIGYLSSYFLSQHFYTSFFIAIAKITVFNFYLFPNKVFLYFIQNINYIIMEFSN